MHRLTLAKLDMFQFISWRFNSHLETIPQMMCRKPIKKREMFTRYKYPTIISIINEFPRHL